MRVPVVDVRSKPLMPCSPARARLLIKQGKALPKRNKLGIFYVKLTYEAEPSNQVITLGVDPGSKFEGFCVVGTEHTVLNIMSEAVTNFMRRRKPRPSGLGRKARLIFPKKEC